jgi:hypothetical protein
VRPSLSDVLGVVMVPSNEREIVVEYKNWRPTHYYLEQRDAFLASIAESISLIKGSHFSFRMEPMFAHYLPERPLLMSLVRQGLRCWVWVGSGTGFESGIGHESIGRFGSE